MPSEVNWEATYRLAWQHKQAEENSNGADDRCCKRCNAYEQEAINSGLHERVVGINVHTKGLGESSHIGTELQQKQRVLRRSDGAMLSINNNRAPSIGLTSPSRP